MESEKNRANIIKRILGRLPQNQPAANVAALREVLGESDDINHRSFDFQVVTDSETNQFIATPYTSGEHHENSHRSPFTQKYEPGTLEEAVPLADNTTFKEVESTLNSIMQTYIKMYFGQGVGNFYSLDADQNTLRGLFILQSTDKNQKKVNNGSWKAMAPTTCTLVSNEEGKRKFEVDMKHSLTLHYECESKYFGKLSVSSYHEIPCHKEFTETEKYTDKNLYQLFLKCMGRTLEEVESRALREHFDVYYSRLKDIICQCRQLQENNEFYSEKKKLIGAYFK